MNRLFVRPYVATLAGYFTRLKLPLSRMVDRTRPRLSRLILPYFASVEDLAAWMDTHLRWRMDRLNGLLDVFPSLEHAAWQLEHRGQIADDCDGLALVAAQGALQLADFPGDVYVVTMVLDPEKLPVTEAAHAICVFRRRGEWYVVSNGKIDARQYSTFQAAVSQNDYSRGYEIKFLEARDTNLERVAPPDH